MLYPLPFTANNLNKFLAFIVWSLPALSIQLSTGASSPSFPTVSPSEIERRIDKLRKSIFVLWISRFLLLEPSVTSFLSPCLSCLTRLQSLGEFQIFGNRVLLPLRKRKTESLAFKAFDLLLLLLFSLKLVWRIPFRLAKSKNPTSYGPEAIRKPKINFYFPLPRFSYWPHLENPRKA